jgi:O-antigen ligase
VRAGTLLCGRRFLGAGAGSFAAAAGLNPLDTAHNTALSILVSGGLCAFLLAVCIVIAVAQGRRCETRGTLRMALMTVLLVWVVTSLVATVEESRTTWLLLGLIAVAGRLGREDGERVAACFPEWFPGRIRTLTDLELQSVGG